MEFLWAPRAFHPFKEAAGFSLAKSHPTSLLLGALQTELHHQTELHCHLIAAFLILETKLTGGLSLWSLGGLGGDECSGLSQVN